MEGTAAAERIWKDGEAFDLIAKEWSRVFIGLTYSDPRFQGAPLMRGLRARIWAAVPGEEG
jgi:hypothetical protein